MNSQSSPELILERIASQVTPLKPPVMRFEKSIRTSSFRILISVLLSSRTKDDVTMGASKRLFGKADTPEKMIKLSTKEIEELIYPVGFFKQKAKNIVKISDILITKGGMVPNTMDELTSLPGVGRKTANLVLALAFNIPSIAVDIHVFRISKRIGWAFSDTPDTVEEELKKIFPKQAWEKLNRTLVGFGQTLCKPRNPLCSECNISHYCSFYKKFQKRISDN